MRYDRSWLRFQLIGRPGRARALGRRPSISSRTGSENCCQSMGEVPWATQAVPGTNRSDCRYRLGRYYRALTDAWLEQRAREKSDDK